MRKGLITAQFDVLSHTLLEASDKRKCLLWIPWFRFESWISCTPDVMVDVTSYGTKNMMLFYTRRQSVTAQITTWDLTASFVALSFFVNINERWRRSGMFSPRLADSMLTATRHYVFCRDMWYERSFNPFPGKATTESQEIWKIYELFILWRHTLQQEFIFGLLRKITKSEF